MSELNYWSLGEKISLRDAFGLALTALAGKRDDFVLFDADVAGGTGSKPFVKAFPEKTIQFGIAEQNMMAAAAGFADTGIIPVVTTFAAFGVMRAHEQFRTAIAYAQRNVKLCCSHLGLDVGPDGATAQMLEDLGTMRAIPNVTVVVPADANQLMKALPAVLDHQGPVYMRIGRSPAPVITGSTTPFAIGKAYRMREGNDLTLAATGVMVARALEAADFLQKEGISARVVNVSTIKPLDREEILAAARETRAILTAEDHNVFGGMGSAIAELLSQELPVPMKIMGVQDQFGKSGEPEELAERFGLSTRHLVQAAKELMHRRENLK